MCGVNLSYLQMTVYFVSDRVFVVGRRSLTMPTSPTTASSSKPYAAKAHEYVPEFKNRAADYKEYKGRVLIYEKKTQLASRATETAFNVMASLTGRAWDACEDLPMDQLESEGGTSVLLERLDAVFKYDAISELPADFEAFFMHMRRGRHQTIQEYTADFEHNLRKLEAHIVTLPEKVIGTSCAVLDFVKNNVKW